MTTSKLADRSAITDGPVGKICSLVTANRASVPDQIEKPSRSETDEARANLERIADERRKKFNEEYLKRYTARWKCIRLEAPKDAVQHKDK